MRAEAYYFVANGVLETQDYRYRDNHHSQTDSYTHRGYADSRNADIMFAFLSKDSFGNEKRYHLLDTDKHRWTQINHLSFLDRLPRLCVERRELVPNLPSSAHKQYAPD